jgi:DNA repair protein RecO (recombination protein O)
MSKGGESPAEAPALVVSAALMGETAARVHVLTEAQGLVRGMVHGGGSRAGRALWQPGNVVRTAIRQRGETGLPAFSGELLYGCAGRLFSAPLALAMVQSACTLLDTTLPEREPCLPLFAATVRLLSFLGYDAEVAEREGMPHYIQWEAELLRALGFGLDLSACAVTGRVESLAYVSPRSGRAVSEEGAGAWKDRLLPLPAFLRDAQAASTVQDWRQGLALTGYFLARHAFGQRHQPLPAARERLAERLAQKDEAG